MDWLKEKLLLAGVIIWFLVIIGLISWVGILVCLPIAAVYLSFRGIKSFQQQYWGEGVFCSVIALFCFTYSLNTVESLFKEIGLRWGLVVLVLTMALGFFAYDYYAKKPKAQQQPENNNLESSINSNLQQTNDLAKHTEEKGADYWYNLGSEHTEVKDYDNAIMAYSKAIALDSGKASAYRKRGFAYDRKKLYDNAIADYSTAINKVIFECHWAHTLRSLAYTKKGLYDKALADSNVAIAIKATGLNYSIRGSAYFEMGVFDLAIIDYEKLSP